MILKHHELFMISSRQGLAFGVQETCRGGCFAILGGSHCGMPKLRKVKKKETRNTELAIHMTYWELLKLWNYKTSQVTMN